MKTDSFISTISYNTTEHLKRTLEKLQEEGLLDFWAFLRHKGEHDPIEPELVEKDHHHLLLKPKTQIDTVRLGAYFDEADPEDATRPPLGVTWWQKTKMPFDWIFYTRHDTVYLEGKGEVKEFYDYPWADFVTSDIEQFRRLRAKGAMIVTKTYRTVNALVKQGLPIEQILSTINPGANQTKYVTETIYQCLRTQGRSTVQVDLATGKVIGKEDIDEVWEQVAIPQVELKEEELPW